ncbi:ABC transporter permease [Methanobrevibacter sp. OttesenSCG-928-K11]|nr:ABC transporter permease [Methanobrevibacter sp. OttesenSCG-928-K11]
MVKISFFKLILKNPFRNKSRASLSILGIAIGIITIIALGAITNGLIVGAEDTLHAGGTDFMIMGSAVNTDEIEFMDSSWNSKISNIKGVNSTIPLVDGYAIIENGNFLSLQGISPNDLSGLGIKVVEGKNFQNSSNELILGKVASDRLNKTVGDIINIDDTDWKVVGISESGNPNIDAAAFTSADMVQKTMNEEGKFSEIYVKADKGVDVENLVKDIESQYGENITVISSIADMQGTEEILQMLNGAKWGISLLAIIVGGIGIINTMIMSVYERTREIGVLKAVGWSSRRIIGMIVAESIVITLAAGIVGSIFGVALIELINMSGMLEGMVPVLSVGLFVEAIAISLIVGIVGGLYPAIKASKMPPTEALRYE